MSFEKPVSLKRQEKRKHSVKVSRKCVIHNANIRKKETLLTFTQLTWNKVSDSKTFYQTNENTKPDIIRLCYELPLTLDDLSHGYHKSCYAYFTDLKKKLYKQ